MRSKRSNELIPAVVRDIEDTKDWVSLATDSSSPINGKVSPLSSIYHGEIAFPLMLVADPEKFLLDAETRGNDARVPSERKDTSDAAGVETASFISGVSISSSFSGITSCVGAVFRAISGATTNPGTDECGEMQSGMVDACETKCGATDSGASIDGGTMEAGETVTGMPAVDDCWCIIGGGGPGGIRVDAGAIDAGATDSGPPGGETIGGETIGGETVEGEAIGGEMALLACFLVQRLQAW